MRNKETKICISGYRISLLILLVDEGLKLTLWYFILRKLWCQNLTKRPSKVSKKVLSKEATGFFSDDTKGTKNLKKVFFGLVVHYSYGPDTFATQRDIWFEIGLQDLIVCRKLQKVE